MRYAMTMIWRGPGIRFFMLAAFFALLAMFLAPPPGTAQEGDTSLSSLVPSLPDGRRGLALALSVSDAGSVTAADLQVYRLGHAGSLSVPRSLDLPEGPTAFQPEGWDWLRARGTAIDLYSLEPYRIWLRIEPDAHLLLIDDAHLELVHGRVGWRDESDTATRRHVSAGPLLVRGRGRAALRRGGGELDIAVERGRFEVERNGELLVVLGAGQERSLTADPGWAADARSATLERFAALRELREDLILTLMATPETNAAPVPDGDTLARLWERTVRVLPAYASAEQGQAAWLPAPDLRRREIGESLRMLAAFRFVPPPSVGM